MNAEVILQIILISISILIGVAVLAGLGYVVYLFGKRSIRDNPQNGLILLKTGSHTKAIKAKLSAKSNKGSKYIYNGGVVVVPSTYEEIYHNGKRLLFKSNQSQVITSPFDSDTELINSEKDNLLYELTVGQLLAEGLRSMRGKSSNILIIAIIAFVIGAIATFGVVQYLMPPKQVPVSTPTQQQNAATNNNTIEVK